MIVIIFGLMERERTEQDSNYPERKSYPLLPRLSNLSLNIRLAIACTKEYPRYF